MKFYFTFFLLCLNALSISAQYKVINQNSDIEYIVNGKYDTVKINKTILHRTSVIRTNEEFYIKNIIDNSIKKCPPSKKGEALYSLLNRKGERLIDYEKTSIDKGIIPSVNETVINEINSISPISFNYLIVDIRNFVDNYWKSFPISYTKVDSLAKAIEKKMIPYNNYYLKGHQIIVDPAMTTKNVIMDYMKTLADSIQPYNNEIVLLYLSSHGVKDKDDNFHFVTSDTHYDSLHAKIEGSVDSEVIIKCINNFTSKGAKVLLFVDACYAGALIKDIGKVDGSCVYFVSTDNNKIAKEDSEKGSPFIRALTNSISGEEQLFFRATDNVVNPDNLNDYLTYSVQREFSEQKPAFYPLKIDTNYKLWSIKPVMVEKLDSLIRVAESGNTNAMIELGRLYSNEQYALKYDIKTDTSKALTYFEHAYILGDPRAACYLGMYYYYNSTPVYKKAFKYFEESSNMGCNLGTYYLYVCYYKGRGIKPDKRMAKRILGKLKSVDPEIEEAYRKENVFSEISINKLGKVTLSMTNNGEVQRISTIHVGKDNIDRILNSDEWEWSFLEEMSASNAPKNIVKVGFAYLYGTEKRTKNYSRAYLAFEKAALKKYGLGYYGLGLIYAGGSGVEKDYQKAEEYYRKAVNKRCYEAYVSWGNLYFIGGNGINKDVREAVVLWKKAADKENVNGMYKYGLCLQEGLFLKKDEAAAFSYFYKCAQKSHAESQYLVGEAMFYGLGTNRDKVEALKWLTKAKENNIHKAKVLIDEGYYADGTPIE